MSLTIFESIYVCYIVKQISKSVLRNISCLYLCSSTVKCLLYCFVEINDRASLTKFSLANNIEQVMATILKEKYKSKEKRNNCDNCKLI